MKTCPQCHLLLERVEREGATIWACRNCGGCWLARDDMRRAKLDGGRGLAALGEDYGGVASEGTFEGLTKTCPECRIRPLGLLPAPDAPEVSVLTCAQCGGAWLQPADRTALTASAGPPVADAEPEPLRPALVRAEGEESGPPAPAPDLAVADAPAAGAGPGPVTADVPTPGAVADAAPSAEAGSTPPSAAPVADAPAAPPAVDEGPSDGAAAAEAPPERASVPDSLDAPPPESALVGTVGAAVPAESVGPIAAFQAMPAAATQEPPDAAPAGAELAEPVAADVHRPLTEPRDAVPEVVHTSRPAAPARPVIVRAARWCPRCRRGYPAEVSYCVDCGVALVAAGHRIRCAYCFSENTIGADRCWQCHVELHPDGEPGSLPARPPLYGTPPPVRIRTAQQFNLDSCSSSVVAAVAALAAVGALIAGALR